MPTTGTLSLYVNEEKVGEGSIQTQPGKFALAGEGLNIGRDGADGGVVEPPALGQRAVRLDCDPLLGTPAQRVLARPVEERAQLDLVHRRGDRSMCEQLVDVA